MGHANLRRLEPKSGKPISRKMVAGWGLLLFSLSSYGQTPTGMQPAPVAQRLPESSAKTPSVSVRSDEVSLNLVVHDKKKKVVLDLKPSDIAITDNGTPVMLSDLHLVKGKSNTKHLITLVFDPMEGPAAKNASEIADKILKMVPETGFDFAVLSLGSRLRLVQGFTSDNSILERAVAAATKDSEVQRGSVIAAAEKNLMTVSRTGVDSSGKMVSATDRPMAQVLLAALEGSQRIVQDQHTRPSLAGLLALARSQQQLEDRKTVIYFTRNGQLDEDAKQMVHTIIGAANRANVSMYTVDMTGIGAGTRDELMTMMAMGPLAGVNPTAPTVSPMAALMPKGMGTGPLVQTRDPAGPGAGSMIATNTASMEGEGVGDGIANGSPLAALAASTGGAYIDGQDSVKKPLAQMLQDMTVYYQASYVPPPQEYDGTFRQIGVKPLRTGLKIRAKSGYFSLPSGGSEGIRPFEAPLLKILSESQLPSDLNFHASVIRLGDLPDGNTNTLAIEVPLSETEMRKDFSTKMYSARVSIVAQVKDKNGTVVEHYGEDTPRHGALEAIEKSQTEFITLQRHFIAIPGEYLLEAAVMDGNSGKAGAQRIKFVIPEPVAGPSLSDMVLVRQLETYKTEGETEEPLRYGNGKVTPNLSGEIPDGAKSVSLFFILHPNSKAAEAPTLELEVLRDGSSAGRTPLSFRPGKNLGAVPYLATLQTSFLSPGLYDVTARMKQGGNEVENTISFTVPGSRTANISDGGNALTAVDEKLTSPGVDPHSASKLIFTVPDKAVPPPSPEELRAIIADTRQRATGYGDGLPNFMCVEVTNRMVDPRGGGRWKHKDTVVELLRYRDKSETRTILDVDGKRVNGETGGLKGARSIGEFGGVLDAVFQLSSKADLTWKETDSLGSGTVQVFDYRVQHDNSTFKVTGANGDQITVGFHGQVFIDSASRSVRRITLVADDLPPDFSVRETAIAVDYDYVVINAHDYLMPVAGKITLKQGKRSAMLNQFEFRAYRRFGSNVRILGSLPAEKQ